MKLHQDYVFRLGKGEKMFVTTHPPEGAISFHGSSWGEGDENCGFCLRLRPDDENHVAGARRLAIAMGLNVQDVLLHRDAEDGEDGEDGEAEGGSNEQQPDPA